MNIVVNEELKAYIDPLTPEEYEALERSILAEGCRDALVLWGDVLVDGHNRYGICQKHGLPFQTVQNTRFKTIAGAAFRTFCAACSHCARKTSWTCSAPVRLLPRRHRRTILPSMSTRQPARVPKTAPSRCPRQPR